MDMGMDWWERWCKSLLILADTQLAVEDGRKCLLVVLYLLQRHLLLVLQPVPEALDHLPPTPLVFSAHFLHFLEVIQCLFDLFEESFLLNRLDG
jgi:hypothetical protein